MKKYLATGFITLLPITLTLMIVVYLFDLFTTPFAGIVEKFILRYEIAHNLSLAKHEELVLFISQVVVFLFLLALTLVVGFLGRKLFFKQLLRLTNSLFSRIPFIKGIYSVSRDLTNAVFTPGTKTFKQTILIPFPNTDMHTVAFITGDAPPLFASHFQETKVAIFVPTAPHPISGYMLLSSKNLIKEVDVSVEDAFKFLISCGAIHPDSATPSSEEK